MNIKYTDREGFFAVMAAIYSPNYLLLIKNSKEKEPRWKFIGESAEPGEMPLDTLVRGVWEEGGFRLYPIYDMFGCAIGLQDPGTRVARVLGPADTFIRYEFFYKIRISDARLEDLSGKQFPGADADEFFETRKFSIKAVPKMEDFHKPHIVLYDLLLRAA